MTVWTKRLDSTVLWSRRRDTNVFLPYSWTTANRPTDLVDGLTGFNTDLKGIEVYILSSAKWRVLSGVWTVATRPDSTLIDVGSQGYNTELGQVEMWDGTDWLAL